MYAWQKTDGSEKPWNSSGSFSTEVLGSISQHRPHTEDNRASQLS